MDNKQCLLIVHREEICLKSPVLNPNLIRFNNQWNYVSCDTFETKPLKIIIVASPKEMQITC